VPLRPRAPTESLTDEALLAGMAVGDQQATSVFVARYQARLFGIAMGVLGDRAAAEDVAQEAFVRAWRHAAAFDPRRGSVAAWLARITRNLAIDSLRMRRAEVTDPAALVGLGRPSAATSVEDAAVTADSAAGVRAALRLLPPEQARALLLAAFYGRTAEEISRSEGVPLGTAKTRIRLALRKVREQLADPAAVDVAAAEVPVAGARS
jgi:RNA polymerase sigma factor (sigma-70 family)